MIGSKHVFDKAKYHDDTVQQLGLDEDQAFVHTGLFVAWLVNNNLMSDFFVNETGHEIEKLKARKISPSQVYIHWDGVFLGALLNEEGFNFAMHYFDFDKGQYLSDYEKVFEVTGNQFFEVKDTWDNYDKLTVAIDSAYTSWKK